MKKNISKCLAIVVPCLNEQEVLLKTNNELLTLLHALTENNLINLKSYILFVDDGSFDDTWTIIKQLCEKHKSVRGLKLSKNFGHQNALLAGLTTVNDNCDFTISIDADLQQDINAIPEMIEKYYSGAEIVFGIRNSRTGEPIFKKVTGILFNKIIKILGGNLIKDHADFRLMGNNALKALLQHSENNIFIRGLVSNLGFQTSIVKFHQYKRERGKTKYNLIKMSNLAYNGLSSLTVTPLRFLFLIGLLSTFVSIIWVIYVLYVKYITGQIVPGWASIVLSIWVFSSIQLVALGLIGEYLSKIFFDVKKRPRFIIENEVE
jgi:glycosyltransferase involved in cell wall biosynthesis